MSQWFLYPVTNLRGCEKNGLALVCSTDTAHRYKFLIYRFRLPNSEQLKTEFHHTRWWWWWSHGGGTWFHGGGTWFHGVVHDSVGAVLTWAAWQTRDPLPSASPSSNRLSSSQPIVPSYLHIVPYGSTNSRSSCRLPLNSCRNIWHIIHRLKPIKTHLPIAHNWRKLNNIDLQKLELKKSKDMVWSGWIFVSASLIADTIWHLHMVRHEITDVFGQSYWSGWRIYRLDIYLWHILLAHANNNKQRQYQGHRVKIRAPGQSGHGPSYLEPLRTQNSK